MNGQQPVSIFLSNLHHAYAQLDGTYNFPNSREGDMLKTAKREIEELRVLLSRAQDAQATRNAALEEIIGCFDAAEIEGLSQALQGTQDERLKDLVMRRLMYAKVAAESALQSAPAQQNRVINEAVSMPSDTPYVADRWVCEDAQVAQKGVWTATVEKAAENARYVFKDSCNHTHESIDYMKQVMLTAAPQVAPLINTGAIWEQAICEVEERIKLAEVRPNQIPGLFQILRRNVEAKLRAAPQVTQEEEARNFRPSWIEHQLRRMYMLGASHHETDKPVAVKATEWAATIMAAAPQSDAQQSEKDAAIVAMSDALKKIDTIMQAMFEGGYGVEKNANKNREIVGLAQTWLKHANAINIAKEQGR